MKELLLTIDLYLWILLFMALAAFFIKWMSEKQLSSSIIAIGVIVLIDGIGMNLKYTLIGIKTPDAVEFVRFLWYMGFAALDYLAVLLIYKIHLTSKTPYSFISKMYCLAYCTAGIMQAVRYGERYLFHTDFLQSLYQNGILAINLTTTTIASIFTVIVMISTYRQSKGKEGLSWKV